MCNIKNENVPLLVKRKIYINNDKIVIHIYTLLKNVHDFYLVTLNDHHTYQFKNYSLFS